MTSLQLLVESILSDLVDARAQADMHAAELAEEYRKHPVLRSLGVPTLNISNASIELKFTFDKGADDDVQSPTEEQKQAIEESAKAASAKIMQMRSVTSRVTNDRSRLELEGRLNHSIVNTMVEYIDRERASRRVAVENAIRASLARYQVERLAAADNDVLLQLVQAIDDAFERVPKKKRRLPRLVVAGEALSQIDQSAVSSIRFDVDLTERHWTALEDDEGGETDRLTEG